MIQKDDILKAQQAWKSYMLSFGAMGNGNREAQVKRAKEFYRTLYNNDELSFKPTKAAKIAYRNDLEGFTSYFIGGNPDYPEDKGFVGAGFRDIRFENKAIIIKNDYAIAGGWYHFDLPDGGVWTVEYTFVYEQDGDDLKIVAHHSSQPYSG